MAFLTQLIIWIPMVFAIYWTVSVCGIVVTDRWFQKTGPDRAFIIGFIALFSIIITLTFIVIYFPKLHLLLPVSFWLANGAAAIYLVRHRHLLSLINVRSFWSLLMAFFVVFVFQFAGMDGYDHSTPANNFVRDLPIDYNISLMFAQSLQIDEKLVFGDWLGSDRPPLLSGAIMFFNPGFVELEQTYLHVGSLIQLLIVPVMLSLVGTVSQRRFGLSTALVFTVFVCLTPLFTHNVTFLWPKILSATFLLIAFKFLFFTTELDRRNVILAALAMFLAFVSHGGAAFAIGGFALLYLAMRRSLDYFKNGLLMAAIFVVAYLPWFAYQKLVQPPGDRLLKWQLLGQIEPTEASFFEVFVEKYSGFTAVDFFARIFESVRIQFSSHFSSISNADSLDSFASEFVVGSFFKVIPSIGAGGVVLILVSSFLCSLRILKISAMAFAATFLGWASLSYGGATALHEGTYFVPALLIMFIGFGLASTAGLARVAMIAVLLSSASINAFLFQQYRTHETAVSTITPDTVYRVVSKQNFDGGTDYDRTETDGLTVLGTYLTADMDKAVFTVEAEGGNSYFYRTGPNAGGQSLTIRSKDQIISQMQFEVISEWTRFEIEVQGPIEIEVSDQGDGFGQWSAIMLRDDTRP